MANFELLEPAELTALMCARLAHDLINPTGAVVNAVHMLDDPTAADMHDDALDLLRGSGRQAWARLDYLRIAFGSGGSAPGRIDLGELRNIVTKRFADSKHRFQWRVRTESFEKSAARILLNLGLLATEALPRGGEITLEASADGSKLRALAEGNRVRLAEHVVAGFEGRAPEKGFEPHTVHAYYTALLTRKAGGRATVIADEQKVDFLAVISASADLHASVA